MSNNKQTPQEEANKNAIKMENIFYTLPGNSVGKPPILLTLTENSVSQANVQVTVLTREGKVVQRKGGNNEQQ